MRSGILLLAAIVTFHASDTVRAEKAVADQEPEQAIGIRIDDAMVWEIAKHSPAAAALLASFRPGHWTPPRNLLKGMGMLHGRQTLETVKAIMAGADADTIRASMVPMPGNERAFLYWSGVESGVDTILVTIESRRGLFKSFEQPEALEQVSPDITIVVRKDDPVVLSYRIGDKASAMTPVPPLDAMGALRTYLTHLLGRNYEGAAALTHAVVEERLAPDGNLAQQLGRFRTTLPNWYELGEPQVYGAQSDRLVLVPARHVTKGFPVDIRMPMVYTVASHDAGRTWAVVDSFCLSLDRKSVV